MKVLRIIVLLGFLYMGSFQVFSQPFTLNKELKPIKIELQDDTRKGYEGGKFIATLSTVDSTKYYYVTGHDMFQFIDIIVKGFGNKNPLEASLVFENWKNVEQKQSTKSAKDGIIHFKIRAWGSFGLKIDSPSKETINFTIMVQASKQNKTYLNSPFTKIKDNEMKAGKTSPATNNENNGGSSSNNTILYIVLGVAILIIGLLAGKLLGKKPLPILALLLFVPLQVPTQNRATPGFFHKDRYYNGEDLDNGKFEEDLKSEMGGDVDFDDLNDKLNSIKDFLESAVNLYNSYKGLSSCISSTPPAGQPRIPSFCSPPSTNSEIGDDNTCAGCFSNAREEFNNVRYLFEQLATIYKCTKSFSNAALSFGDNASGVHGVAGLAWQNERRNIEKSILDLEKAYDKKYAELLQSLSAAMYKLSECEAKYGVEDWFDRFGYMYFEFIKDKYQRKD